MGQENGVVAVLSNISDGGKLGVLRLGQPVLSVTAGAASSGTYPAGAYQVRLSAIDFNGGESFLTPAVPITMASNGSLIFAAQATPVLGARKFAVYLTTPSLIITRYELTIAQYAANSVDNGSLGTNRATYINDTRFGKGAYPIFDDTFFTSALLPSATVESFIALIKNQTDLKGLIDTSPNNTQRLLSLLRDLKVHFLFPVGSPAFPAASASTGTLPAATYTYNIASQGSNGGFSRPSSDVAVTLASPGGVAFAAGVGIDGAVSYRFYRRSSTSSLVVAFDVSPATFASGFTDNGSLTLVDNPDFPPIANSGAASSILRDADIANAIAQPLGSRFNSLITALFNRLDQTIYSGVPNNIYTVTQVSVG